MVTLKEFRRRRLEWHSTMRAGKGVVMSEEWISRGYLEVYQHYGTEDKIPSRIKAELEESKWRMWINYKWFVEQINNKILQVKDNSENKDYMYALEFVLDLIGYDKDNEELEKTK